MMFLGSWALGCSVLDGLPSHRAVAGDVFWGTWDMRCWQGSDTTPPPYPAQGSWESSTVFRVLGAFGSLDNILITPRHSQLWAR